MSLFNNNSTQGTSNIFGAGSTPSTNTTTGPTNAFAAKPSGGIFGGGGGNIFGGTGSSTIAPAGGGLFGAGGTTSSAAPASTAGNIFGGGNAVTTGGSAFGSTSNVPSTGNVFGGGANTSTTSTNNPSSASIFAGSAFSIPKPAEQIKPVSTDFFSQPSTIPATQPSTSNPPNGLFSLPPKPAATSSTPAASTSTTTSGIPTTGLFGGNLFSKPSTPSTTTPAPTTIPPTFSLGGNKDALSSSSGVAGLFAGLPANKETEKKDSTPAAGFGLFGGTKQTDKKDIPTTASTPGSKEGGQPGSAINTVPSTPFAPSPVVAVPPPSMLRGKTLEEIVNRWTTETETNIREFNKFAGEVAVWDRALIENGNNIAALYGHVLAAERNQNEINESLDHVEQQQKELGSILDSYEKVLSQDGSFRAMDTGPADNERDKNYMLATDLHTHLDDLSGSLKQMIDSVNELSIASKPGETNDEPLSQIAQILSSHLESLQWIDSAVRDIEGKTTEVEKRVRESGHNLSNTGGKSRAFGLNR